MWHKLFLLKDISSAFYYVSYDYWNILVLQAKYYSGCLFSLGRRRSRQQIKDIQENHLSSF